MILSFLIGFNSLNFSQSDSKFSLENNVDKSMKHKSGSARVEIGKIYPYLFWCFTLEISFLPGKPLSNTLVPRIDHISGDAIIETNPVSIFNSELYT